MPKNLVFLQFNMASSISEAHVSKVSPHSQEFEKTLKTKKVRIALLQDISKHYKPPRDYHLYSRPDGSSGVLVHKTVPSEINKYLTSKTAYLSSVGVTLYPESRFYPLTVVSVYRKDYDNPR